MALAAAVRQLRGPFRLVGATVDHGLQAGSADRAAATAALLTDLGYPEVSVLTVSVDGPGGPEAAARTARYNALRGLAERVDDGGPVAVLLAHTRDDQAETVLLGLARGSGPRSIAGMRAWRPPWGRPLLGVSRAQTETSCVTAGLRPWQDPHNSDLAFTRVRLRTQVLPLLEDALGGGVRPALARTAELMAQDLDALDEIAAAVAAEVVLPDGSVSVEGLARHPAAIRGRVLRSWAAAAGATPLDHDHLSRMSHSLEKSGPSQVRLPAGFDMVRSGGRLHMVDNGAVPRMTAPPDS